MPQIKLIVEGGAMKPGPTVAQQIGPLGLNMGKIIEDTNAATKGFKGMKVPVVIDVDAKAKTFTITVSSPPVSELIKKEAKTDKGSGLAGRNYAGNLAIEEIISVAKTKMPSMLARNLRSAVKLTLGSCVSAGILVESKNAKEVIADLEEGKYDIQIDGEKTEVSQERKKELDEFFNNLKSEQDAKAKAEAAAKEAEDATKKEEAKPAK
jgi:large subunit ribosomal protein L11